MQALEVRIPGTYWDSLLYNGRLYLFTREGEIHVHDWDRLAHAIGWSSDLGPLAMQFLTRGRAWYSPEIQQLLRAASTREHLVTLVAALTGSHYVVSDAALGKSRLWQTSSPAFPHADVETYANTLFVASSGGVYERALGAAAGWGSFDRISDAPAARISASYGALAIAAGAEGLFEQQLGWNRYPDPSFHQVSDRHCSACSWASFDVVGSSTVSGGGYVAAYSRPSRGTRPSDPRTLLGVVDAEELFDQAGRYLFAAGDKLIMLGDGYVDTETWNPFRRREGRGPDVEYAKRSHSMVRDRRRTHAGILDAAASTFGYVVEFEDALAVFASDGTSRRYGEPVNWRCFPRSARYLNHLHVVKEDHIRVFAYTHDYFLRTNQRGPAMRRPRGLGAVAD